jgi:hypothetical protein
VANCHHCSKYSVWLDGRLIYPTDGSAPPPNTDLSEDVLRDYNEARAILVRSPRGAAALLRLAIQKLLVEFGEKGKNINQDIGRLVRKELPVTVQQAMDSLRVFGNEAVHPGQIDMSDDTETATALFGLVNIIADRMISEPKRVAELYAKIPPEKRAEIEARDAET